MSSYYLAPIARGLGDLIVSLPALRGLIATGVPTYLIMRSAAQHGLAHRISGLAGTFDEMDFDPAKMNTGDKYFNLREHKLQTEYIWGSPEFARVYPNYLIGDIVEEISKDLGITYPNIICSPLLFEPVRQAQNKAIFIPGSAGSMKCWPAKHWLELSELFKKDGMETIVLGEKDKCKAVLDVCQIGLKHIETPDLEQALDIISSAKLVVGVDTGLSHLAVNQRIPTVMLFRYNSIFRRELDHVSCLIAPECLSQCLIRELSEGFNSRLDFRGQEQFEKISYWETWHCAQENDDLRCISQIEVGRVASAALNLLNRVVKPLH